MTVARGVRITQGTFSYLPDLTDEQIALQIQYGMERGWAPSIEFTDDPHPRNAYWEMWGMPMFDVGDASQVVRELNRCRESFPRHYIRVSLFNSQLTKQTTVLQFIVNRPAYEPGFRLERQQGAVPHYVLHSYATDNVPDERRG
jgi:ribulose-bisphosphate carboxylase small chain